MINLDLKPFRFPNYLTMDTKVEYPGDSEPRIDVAELSDDEAMKYWKELQHLFVQHCRDRRNKLASKNKEES
jgi:hypothetical protein